jgi:hypothetical protein
VENPSSRPIVFVQNVVLRSIETMMKQLFSVFTLLGCFLLAACSFSTREDITPPPGIEQSVSQSPKTQTGDETESNPPITKMPPPPPGKLNH